MQKRYYSADHLGQTLDAFEKAYNMSTAAFMDAHRHDDESVLKDVPNSSRSQWAMFARSFKRMCGGGLAAHVANGLQPA